MLRRTAASLGVNYGQAQGLNGVAKDMVQLWRLYRHSVGEVYAEATNIHWTVDDAMLRDYLQQFAEVKEVKVDRVRMDREKRYDPRRVVGRSRGTAKIVFRPDQSGALSRLFSTRHVVQGREMRLIVSAEQPRYNFYIPNTHEADAAGSDPSQVPKMAEQVVNLNRVVGGTPFDNYHQQHQQATARMMRLRDRASHRSADPLDPEEVRGWYDDDGDPFGPEGDRVAAAARGEATVHDTHAYPGHPGDAESFDDAFSRESGRFASMGVHRREVRRRAPAAEDAGGDEPDGPESLRVPQPGGAGGAGPVTGGPDVGTELQQWLTRLHRDAGQGDRAPVPGQRGADWADRLRGQQSVGGGGGGGGGSRPRSERIPKSAN